MGHRILNTRMRIGRQQQEQLTETNEQNEIAFYFAILPC